MNAVQRFLLLLSLCLPALGSAAEFDYGLAPRRVADNTYVVIGKTEDFSRSNGGNIVNTGFVVTDAGVVIIDSGPSRRYGEQLRAAVASVTDKPIVRVFNTHHHPDHFLGNQVFAKLPISALSRTIQGQKEEGGAFAENVYRMSGDWIKGTEQTPANEAVEAGSVRIGGHEFEMLALTGHTSGDLAIFDKTTGVLFAGDLVFFNRAPSTPHAIMNEWLEALGKIDRVPYRILVPGHGEPVSDGRAVDQTRRYLEWIDTTLKTSAESGADMNEVFHLKIHEDFIEMPLARNEFARSIAHLYQRYERGALSSPTNK